MPQIPSIPNLIELLRRRVEPVDRSVSEFHVHLVLEPDEPLDRAALEAASLRALEAVETRCGDVALGTVSECNFETGEIELDFTVLAARSSEVHEKIGKVVRALEAGFPGARERSSETEASTPHRIAAVPA